MASDGNLETVPTPPGSAETLPYGDGGGPPPSTLGRFRITRALGRGGMGLVLEAEDPSLDRRIAIKLLQPERWGDDDSDRGRERIVREARAMAKLSHPNVVTVYEVGEIEGRPYLAMELVEGVTLRTWQTEHRTWREIVDVYLGAARGLAAAHAAGLVHRDFKPENVLIGPDHRPRVSDFGLVSAGGHVVTEADAQSAPGLTGLTVKGSILGTPPYMAPEQWNGGAVGPATDQFAFCVSLWEAVYGERPFAGTAATELRDAILDDRRRAPPRSSQVPAWLEHILVRGLAHKAEARWPAMTSVIAEIERHTTPRRGLAVAIAAAAATATLATTGIATLATRSEEPCPPPTERVAALWGPETQAAIRTHLLALDPAAGARRYAALANAMTSRVDDWQTASTSACRASHADSAQTALASRRAACVEERFTELSTILAQIAGATTTAAVDGALPALAALQPAGCNDAVVLASFAPPPGIAERVEAERIAAELRAIDAERRTGNLRELPARAATVLGQARKLAHAPTLSKALLAAALVELDIRSPPTANDLLTELTEVAARAPDDRAAAIAWSRLVRLRAFELGKPDEALAMVPAARAAVARSGDPLDLRVLLLQSHGSALSDAKQHAEAKRRFDEARALLTAAGADRTDSPLRAQLGEVLALAGSAQFLAGEKEPAVATMRQAIAAFDDAYGPDHPATAPSLMNIAKVRFDQNRTEEALALQADAVRIWRSRTGESAAYAWGLSLHGNSLRRLYRNAEALPEVEEAYRVAKRTTSPDDPNLMNMQLAAGALYEDTKRLDRAAQMYGEAIAIAERTHARVTNAAIAYYDRGEIERKLGHCDQAVPDYEHSIELFVEIRGPTFFNTIFALNSLGACLQLLHRPADAIAPLERALAYKSAGWGQEQPIVARWLLGRALVDTGRDLARGRELMEQAQKDAAAIDKATLDEMVALVPPAK